MNCLYYFPSSFAQKKIVANDIYWHQFVGMRGLKFFRNTHSSHLLTKTVSFYSFTIYNVPRHGRNLFDVKRP